MTMMEPKDSLQFRYWDMRRRGMTQSRIAREFGISRQAVNKAVQLYERDVMYRMMDFARSSGSLVEWSDGSRGVLIGRTPQLQNVSFLIVIDFNNRMKIFYDQAANEKREIARKTMTELKNILRATIGTDIRGETTFNTVLRSVYR